MTYRLLFRTLWSSEGHWTDTRDFWQIYYPMAFLGIVAAGAVFAGLNPSYTSFEMRHAIRTADITHLLVEPEFLHKTIRAAKECSIPATNIFAFDTFSQAIPCEVNVRSWDVLQTPGEEMAWEVFDDRRRSEETIVARLFSSGTTGLPKALNVSNWNLVGFLFLFCPDDGLIYVGNAQVAQHTLVMEVNPRPYEVRQ